MTDAEFIDAIRKLDAASLDKLKEILAGEPKAVLLPLRAEPPKPPDTSPEGAVRLR